MASLRSRRKLTSLASVGLAAVLTAAGLVGFQALDARPGGIATAVAGGCDVNGNGKIDEWEVGLECPGGPGPGEPGPRPEPPDPNRTEKQSHKRGDCRLPNGEPYPDDHATEECLRSRDDCADDEPFWMLWERTRRVRNNVPGPWSDWSSVDAGCGEPPPPPPSPEEVAAYLITHVPKGEPQVQPDAKTLVGFPTVFSAQLDGNPTRDDPFQAQTTMNGYTIEIQGWPTAFNWKFGDGDGHSPDQGHPYPEAGWKDVTHPYKKTGPATVDVDVTFEGQFRVNGGEWQDLPPLNVIDGPGETVEVVESVPVLSGK